ncbi:unnamed protein product, partial [Prorocentrum cordatum]
PPARHARHAGAAAQGGPRRAAQPREGAPASRRPPPRPMRGGAAPSSGARADLLSQPAVHRGDGSCRGWTEPPLAKRGGSVHARSWRRSGETQLQKPASSRSSARVQAWRGRQPGKGRPRRPLEDRQRTAH